MSTKVCKVCGIEKPLTEFHKSKNTLSGVRGTCKVCTSAYNRRHYYDLSDEEYQELLEKQGGVCAICKRPERVAFKNGEPIRLAVDHDHETGKVRGLLCGNCNRGIGNLDDSIELLRRAIAYLGG